MDRQDKVNIVTNLVNSHIRTDNELLTKMCRALKNENDALRTRLRRTQDMHAITLRHVQGLNIRVRDLEETGDLMDDVIREYFINHPDRRAAWRPYVGYADNEFERMVDEHDMYGDNVDFTEDRDQLRVEDEEIDILMEDDELMREIQDLLH